MRELLIGLCFMLPWCMKGQEDVPYFILPVKHAVKMSGSFGEIRTNHFHGGIDIKSSKGVDGDPIIAAADGYISRVKDAYGGYGKSLYINHDNGYTTVYAHLTRYTPRIDSLVEAQQMASRSHMIDYYAPTGLYPVKQGEVIGYMGNTGHSFGTHLHFEVRETVTEIPVNPYKFGLGASDSKSPKLFRIGIHEMNDQYTDLHVHTYPIQGNKLAHDVIVEHDLVGVSIQAFDQMDGASNLNGIYDIKMYVGDSLYFHHTMDHFAFHHTRYLNTYIDYEEKKKNNNSYTRCYILPGNPLTFYHNLQNKGFLKLPYSARRKVKIVVEDFYHNRSEVNFYIDRKSSGDIIAPSYHKRLVVNKRDTVSIGHASLILHQGSLDRDVLLNYHERKGENKVDLIIGNKYDPVFNPMELNYDVSHIDPILRDKLIILYDTDKKKVSYGGRYENGKFKADLFTMGNFKIVLDTVPPTIQAKNLKTMMPRSGSMRFHVEDNYEPKGNGRDPEMEVFIDGAWKVASFSYISNMLTVPYKELSSGSHWVKVTAIDHSGNMETFYKEFNVQ